jgi:hypothetical protein
MSTLSMTSRSLLIWALLATGVAHAAEAPECDSKKALSYLKQGLGAALSGLDGHVPKFKIGTVKENGYGPLPKWANEISRSIYEKSRYCQAEVSFSDGRKDLAYFRIDAKREKGFSVESCLLKQKKNFDQNCTRQRPEK